MRKRRITNMSLSPEMIRLSDSYFKKKYAIIDAHYNKQFFNLKREFMMTRDPSKHFLVDQLYVEWAEEKVKARIETYIDAYRRENLVPTDGDINEIKWDLEDIILSTNNSGSVDAKKALEHEKLRIIDAAENDLNIFIQEMKLESRRKPAEPEPTPGHTYNIHIKENRGPIQQGGSGNTQRINRGDDED
jgi:hypothetical protein